MSVEFEYGIFGLTAKISGDVDHHAAAEMRIMIDGELERAMPDLLIFDMSGVTFMDSSGVGLVLGRVRTMKQWDGKVKITEPSARAAKILKMSGLEPMITRRPFGKEKHV